MESLRAVMIVTAVGVATAGCGASGSPPAGAVVRDSAGIRIIELAATPSGGAAIPVVSDPAFPAGGIEFGAIADISVSDGVVAVFDAMETAVVTLDATGRVIARFGRRGRGPGEFHPAGLASIVAIGREALVPDVASQRVTRFAADGSVVDVRPLPLSDGHAVDWTPHPYGGYVYRLRKAPGDLLIGAGAVGVDTLHRFSPSPDAPNTVLPATPLWTILPDGSLVVGWTDRFELVLLDPDNRRPVWIVRREAATRELTDADARHIHGLLEQSLLRGTRGEISTEMRQRLLSETNLPARAPVISAIRTGPDGTIWVEGARAVEEFGLEALRVGEAAGIGSNEWEVYGRDGSFLGTAKLPSNFEVHEFVGPLVYGVEVDEMGVLRWCVAYAWRWIEGLC